MTRRYKIAWALLALALVLNVSLALLLAGGPGFASGQGFNGQPPNPAVVVVKVRFKDDRERDLLAVRWGADEVSTRGGYLTIWASQPQYEQMVAAGLNLTVDKPLTDLANHPKKLFGKASAGDSPCPADNYCGGYRTVEEMQSFLDQMAATYPNLSEKVDYGNSWCKDRAGSCTLPSPYSGYDLLAMHITNRNIAGPKPVFWYEAGIHPREIAVSEVAMNYIQYLLSSYNTNADARWLIDYHDIWVVPMSNPDGHHIVEAAGSGNAYYQRKNANNTANNQGQTCTTWPPSASSQFGVDMNRNYPFQWGAAPGGSSNAPCDQTYRGLSGGSEPEGAYELNKIRQLVADQRGPALTDAAPLTTTGLLQSMHSNAALNLYPWGWSVQGTATYRAPNYLDIDNIAQHMSAPAAGGNNYQSCQSPEPNCLYTVDGSIRDWAYGELGIPAITTELDGAAFFVSLAEANQLWLDNKAMLINLAKSVRAPYLLTHGPDANNVPNVITVTQGVSASLSASINFQWAGQGSHVNRNLQNVGAASYYIDTPPWISSSVAISMNATDGAFNSPTEAVNASIATGSLSPGRHIVFVSGRGATDYAGYQTWGPISAAFLDVTNGGGGLPTDTPAPPAPTSTSLPTITPALPTATTTALPSATPASPTTTPGLPTATTTPATATNTPATATSTPPTTATSTPATATSTPPTTTTSTPALPTASSTVAQPTATTTPCTASFNDVPSGYIFHDDIIFLACRGVINGFQNGSFQPNGNTTRGQFAKIATLGFGIAAYTPQGNPTFSDVPAASPFYGYVESAANANAVSGLSSGQCSSLGLTTPCYGPNLNISRVQVAVIVQRVRNYAAYNPTNPTFSDVPVGSFGYAAIESLNHVGVISGAGCGNGLCFRPNDNIRRGELSKVVHKAIEQAP